MNITKKHIELFQSLFYGQTNIYGTYNPKSGKSWQVKQPVTDEVINKHLEGIQPFGVYLLTKDKTSSVVADFDDPNGNPPRDLYIIAKHCGLNLYIEISKSKGYHSWIFFEEPVPAYKARLVMKYMLNEIEMFDIEIFPKQNTLNHSLFGNFINTPLFGKSINQDKTVFIDIEKGLHPYKNQWELLSNIRRANESILNEIIETNELKKPTPQKSTLKNNNFSYGLLPCAKKMLQGVTTNQRVIAFRLAIHLKKLGFPYQTTIDAIKTWSLKNKPKNSKNRIRYEEIESQVQSAYEHQYNSYGCNDSIITPYCDLSCPIYKKSNFGNKCNLK